MERTKYCIILFLLLLSLTPKASETNKAKIYNAYISNKMDEWRATIDEMEKQKHTPNIILSELINYQYGYIGWCLGNNKSKEAKNYLHRAENNLKILEKKGKSSSLVQAYKSAFYGFKIGLSPYKAPFLGPSSMKNAKLSMKTDPNNYLGFLQYANNQFYMPAAFGGSKEVALENFKKAQALLEKNTKQRNNNWNYLSTMVLVAQTYEALNRMQEAEAQYKKIIKTEPNFKWVVNELYPKFLKKTKQK